MRTSTVLLAIAGFVAVTNRAATAQSVRYVEDFDAASTPNLPIGWSSPDSTWETSLSVASPGSGSNNVVNAGNGPGSIMSPVLDLSAVSSGTVSYLARRTSTYDSLNLQLEASIDGGATWAFVVADSGAALPGSASIYAELSHSLPAGVIGQPAVRIRIRARQTTGGNVRIDDFSISADGSVKLNQIGFSQAEITVAEGQDSVLAAISLSLIGTSRNVQGIQFSLSSSSGLQLEGVTTANAATAGADWHFSTEGADSTIAVVLISETEGLPPPGVDSLFMVTFRADGLGDLSIRRDSIFLENVIVSTASPGGEDLTLAVEPAFLQVHVLPLSPIFTVNSDTLNFGAIAEDSTWQADLLLLNAGTGHLEVADLFSISGRAGISPPFFTLPPDSSTAVTVTIAGADYGPGSVQDWIVFDHNGPTSPDTVAIVGNIVSLASRGDLNGDLVVDIVDLVLGIDLVLDRFELPDANQRIDLHPFPSGNGVVDIRDLTVLAQAIARGVWPDETTLPPQPLTGKTTSPVGDLVINQTSKGVELWVRSSESLRAVHLVGRLSNGVLAARMEGKASSAQFVVPYIPLGDRSFSILLFGLDALPVSDGEPVLVAEIPEAVPADVEMITLLVVDERRERRSLLTVLESSLPIPDASLGGIRAPYPNPADRSTSGLLHIPLDAAEDGEVNIAVTDILGRSVVAWTLRIEAGHRIVSWDLGRAGGRIVAPGLYFLTASTASWRQTRSVTVK